MTVKTFFIFGIIVLLFSCQSKPSEEVTNSTIESSDGITANQIPAKYKLLFKLGDQKKFSFTYGDIAKLKLTRIDSLQLSELLQGDELLGYNSTDFEHYFYSYQAARPGYQAVTVLLNVEYNYSIYYLVFSSDGKLLSKFEVAREGGDEVTTWEYGHFVNDTTYLKTRKTSITGTDSVQQQIVFNSKGKLTYY
jgi:hypothetical protein